MTDTIRVPAERSALLMVRGYVDGVLDTLQDALLEQTRNEIRLAVEEIFVNIADYAYEGKAGHIVVTCITNNVTYVTKNTETVFITFADQGVPFNPLAVPAPDLRVPLEERQKGGFGIYMVKNLADVIEYRREGGWNKLTIGKHIRSKI